MPTVNSDDGARSLLCAVIRQAIDDARRGRPCNGECKPQAHACRQDALAFLRGPACADFLAWLGLEDRQGELVATVQGNPRRRKEAARQLGLFTWAGDPPRARATVGDRRKAV